MVYNNNFVLNDNPHLFSKLFLVTGVQVVWGTLHHLFYLELRQEGPKLCGIWSSWPYYKVPRQLTKNTGGLLRPTFGTQFYLQWPKHLSYGQNKNQWKLFWRYGNVFHRQWEKQCSEYLLSSNANMHTPHLFSCSQILIHFSVLSAITVGLLPSYLLRFYPHSALSRIPLSSCHHWSSFITLSARNFRLNPYS